jgi:hypothetical protein
MKVGENRLGLGNGSRWRHSFGKLFVAQISFHSDARLAELWGEDIYPRYP